MNPKTIIASVGAISLIGFAAFAADEEPVDTDLANPLQSPVRTRSLEANVATQELASLPRAPITQEGPVGTPIEQAVEQPEKVDLESIRQAQAFAEGMGETLLDEPHEYFSHVLLNPQGKSIPGPAMESVAATMIAADEVYLEFCSELSSTVHAIATERVQDGLEAGAWLESPDHGPEIMSVDLTVNGSRHEFIVYAGDRHDVDAIATSRADSIKSANEQIALMIIGSVR